MMKERLEILLNSDVITQDIYDYSYKIYKKYFEKEEFNKDKVNIFITHLAMSLKRINEGDIIDKLDEDVYTQVKNSEVFYEALRFSQMIVNDLDVDIPNNEEEYLILHLGNILLERK